MPRHKHADLIIAWANGAEIQCSNDGMDWRDCFENCPSWYPDVEYRIKPEPKPDVVRQIRCEVDALSGVVVYYQLNANLRLTFSGDDLRLKSAEVI